MLLARLPVLPRPLRGLIIVQLSAALGLFLDLASMTLAQPLLPPRDASEIQQPPEPPAQAPFVLDRQQEAALDQVLLAWQQTSGRVSTFGCTFTLFEYNAVFGPAQKPMRVDTGEIRYVAPDKGMYKVNVQGGEHWMCDGKAIYEFNSTKRQLIESRLPPELQGKAIADGPLPFVFGVNANKLKQRYWMRVTTPAEVQGQIWLEAYPRYRQDAANFKKVDIILTEPNMEPFALQLFEPQGKVRKVYQFTDLRINSTLHKLQDWMGGFVSPQTPLNWKRLVQQAVDPQPPPAGQSVAAPANPAQTQAGRTPPAGQVR